VTRTDVTTFTADQQDATPAVLQLVGLGFEFGAPRTVTRSLLDTFDGRLYQAGLQLELRESDGLELVLTAEGSAPAHLVIPSVPRFPYELPPGPFRSRLVRITDVRALMPTLRVRATRSLGLRRNRAGKTVATATVYEQMQIADHDGPRWTIEVDELPGYPKHANRALAALTEIGLTCSDGDTFGVVAAAAGIGLAGYSDAPGMVLDPGMPAVDGFRLVLAGLSDAIVANWQGTIDQLDPEFLHDLRVAVRRTRSTISEGKKVLPPPIVACGEERFGWLGALTGEARDLDVHLINWATDTRRLVGDVLATLEPVHALLETRSAAAHEKLARALRSKDAADLLTAADSWWRNPAVDEPAGVDAQRPLAKVVSRRIARAHANLVQRGRSIHPETPDDQVHDLRKDAKRLRYLLESFGSLLQDAPRRAFVRRLKAFQDNLGEHHDAAVHVAGLRTISQELHGEGASPETMVAIGQLIAQLDERRRATRLDFAERFAAYDTKSTQRDLDAALGRAR
jgi:CHAD domain-containing protein